MLTSDILPPRTVSSRGMMAMLKRLEEDSGDNYTFKLVPPPLKVSPACGGNAEGKGGPIDATNWAWLPKSALTSPTGLAFLYTKTENTPYQPRLAIAPPFPIQSEVRNHRPRNLNPIHRPSPPHRHHPHPIRLRSHRIAHDETLILTKTETRWVPNRHRAGGQSANRFKRIPGKMGKRILRQIRTPSPQTASPPTPITSTTSSSAETNT